MESYNRKEENCVWMHAIVRGYKNQGSNRWPHLPVSSTFGLCPSGAASLGLARPLLDFSLGLESVEQVLSLCRVQRIASTIA